jgi:hypothetical protein
VKLLVMTMIAVAACGGPRGGGSGQATQPTEPQIEGTPAPPCKDALAGAAAYAGQTIPTE